MVKNKDPEAASEAIRCIFTASQWLDYLEKYPGVDVFTSMITVRHKQVHT